MSEKLRRCRKELTAAIDRAFEDLMAPFHHSEYCIKQNSDLQTNTPFSLPQMNRVSYRRDPASTLTSYLDQSAPVSCALEKENPFFIPNLIPVSIAHNPLCQKREPLTSKENTWLPSPIFVPDRQLPRAPGVSERWRKGHVRYSLYSQFFLITIVRPCTWMVRVPSFKASNRRELLRRSVQERFLQKLRQ